MVKIINEKYYFVLSEYFYEYLSVYVCLIRIIWLYIGALWFYKHGLR